MIHKSNVHSASRLARKLTEETGDYIQGIFIGLSIPVAIMALVFVFDAAILVRFYKKTVRFMENAVKRMKEVKYAMKIVIRRLDAIKLEEKEALVEPLYRDLDEKKTKI